MNIAADTASVAALAHRYGTTASRSLSGDSVAATTGGATVVTGGFAAHRGLLLAKRAEHSSGHRRVDQLRRIGYRLAVPHQVDLDRFVGRGLWRSDARQDSREQRGGESANDSSPFARPLVGSILPKSDCLAGVKYPVASRRQRNNFRSPTPCCDCVVMAGHSTPKQRPTIDQAKDIGTKRH